jgi:hypothetical protein
MPSSWVNKFVLSLVLCLSPISARCSGQWITVALADLPVLTQMAPNIATLVTTLHSGKELSATEAAAIQNISAEANKDLVLLQQLCHEYKASPSVDGIQNIQNVIADLNKNLSALLQAAHVKDPALSMRVNVAVNLILTTVNTFAALIPENSVNAPMQRSAGQQIALAQPKDPETAVEPASVLNERQSGGPDSALSVCPVH